MSLKKRRTKRNGRKDDEEGECEQEENAEE